MPNLTQEPKESPFQKNTGPLNTTSQKEARLFHSLRKNRPYYFRKLLKIEDKAGNLSPLVPNEPQQFILDLIWCLEELNLPVRLVILKARQLGMSTLGAALLFHATSLWPHRHSKVIAHDIETTELLFEKSKMFYRKLPDRPLLKPQTERADRKQLLFAEPLSSRLSISTAGTKTAGSGATVLHLHCSEVAKWENPGTVMTSLLQTVPKPSINPNTTVIMESTANGQGGYFHEQYVGAKEGKEQLMADLWAARAEVPPDWYRLRAQGKLPYEQEREMDKQLALARPRLLKILSGFPHTLGWLSVFFPWHDFPEYRQEIPDLEYFRKTLKPEELELKQKYNLDYEQLQFRRTEIENLKKDERGIPPEELFKQEYPSDDREAFLVTGTTFFDQKALMTQKPQPLLFRGTISSQMKGMIQGKVRDLTYDEWKQEIGPDDQPRNVGPDGKIKLHAHEDLYGPLSVWEHPKEGGQYVIAGDVALGERENSDFSVLQVLRKLPDGKLRQVARWRGKTHPAIFAKYGIQLASYYNEAILGFENNSFGVNCIHTLQESLYPYPYIRGSHNYKTITEAPTDEWGWNTNISTKQMTVQDTNRYLYERLLELNDEMTIDELSIFRQEGSTKLGAPEGRHDDCVMSLAIGIRICMEHPYQKKAEEGSYPLADLREMEHSAEVHTEDWEPEYESSYA